MIKQPLMAYVNTGFVPMEQATVHIEDRGFQFADGVYEVVACFGGAYLDLNLHLRRLQHSCEAIGMGLPRSMEVLESLVKQAYEKNPFEDAMVYIQVTRGVAPRAHWVSKNLTPTLVITVRDLPKPTEQTLTQGIHACTLPDIRWKHCEIKSIALLASVMGKLHADQLGMDETFWLDEQGHVLEGCATNIFAVIDGLLVTHPLDHQVLGGITRDMAITAAQKAGIAFVERPWKLDEAGLTECLMSSTTNLIVPICWMDGQGIGDAAPGPMGIHLRKLMLDDVEQLRRSKH